MLCPRPHALRHSSSSVVSPSTRLTALQPYCCVPRHTCYGSPVLVLCPLSHAVQHSSHNVVSPHHHHQSLTPADFPSFNDCTAASTSLRRMGWSSSVSVWVQFSTNGSPLALWLYNSEQYSVHRFSICRSSVRHFPERSWTVVTFPCFTVVKSHQLVCPLTVVLPQIFFNLTTLFSYPVFFSLFHAPLDVVVHFLVVLRFFRLKSFLSQFSPFVAQIENFCSDPGFFF